MKEKWDSFMGHAGFYVTMAICLVVAGISGYFLLFDREEAPASSPTSATEEAITSMPEIPISPEIHDSIPERTDLPDPVPVSSAPAEMPETEPADIPVVAIAPQLVVPPLRGDVLTAFSLDELIYNPTLNDWRTHDGIDIAAKPGTTVQAACAGTVISVEDDPLMGTTVVVSHADGYETTYSNLQSIPTVKSGDSVSAGQVIGAVGSTAAAESAQNPHLHFSVSQNHAPVDPNEFLKK